MISIIAAIGRQRQIGKDGRLLWHIKEDLQNFKRLTMDHHVIMGRTTYQSLLPYFKDGDVLPGRHPIVLTRQNDFPCLVQTASSLHDALQMAESDPEIFIIGGGQVYTEALHFTDTIYLSEIDYTGEADTFFPDISIYLWFLKNKIEYNGWRFMELHKMRHPF